MRRIRIERNRARRGHNFFPPVAVERKVPALGTTDGLGDDATVWLHYFSPSGDWYVTEWNKVTGEAFGWADLGYGEWGYMSLPEMEAVYVAPFGIIERELDWEPKPMREVFAERRISR